MEFNNHQIEEKKLAHVQVYEKLYNMIMDGTFPVGTRLPAELKLSKMLGVSRMTLRHALGLLHDDGLVQKVQGAGNFVLSGKKTVLSSLEKIGHPVYKCVNIEIDDVETQLKLEPSNDYQKKLLNIETPVIIAVHIWYRNQGKLLAYTFGVMAVESISKYHLDLNDKEQLMKFVQTDLYEQAERSQLTIHPDSAGNSILADSLQEGEHVTMIAEKIFDEELRPVICNKHYIVSEHAVFEVNAKK